MTITVPCRACAAPMIFVKAVRIYDGKETILPLDADGTRRAPHRGEYIGRNHENYRRYSGANLLHTSHFATCPDAGQFARRDAA